ncbi:MAG: TerB family tellurite resistance protein [Gammaproteobacteria bacterium]|nr:TerB family tellurite resistance protein [Gammaproteobacteria bacterium]
MLTFIKNLIKKNFNIDSNLSCDICDKYELRIFTAKLFLQMMYQDGKVTTNEENSVKNAIADYFDLPLNEVDQLFLLSNDLFAYESQCSVLSQKINQQCSDQQKAKIIEHLWLIAYSDNNLHEKEEKMLMDISKCLQVPHLISHKAKLKAQNFTADRKWTH